MNTPDQPQHREIVWTCSGDHGLFQAPQITLDGRDYLAARDEAEKRGWRVRAGLVKCPLCVGRS